MANTTQNQARTVSVTIKDLPMDMRVFLETEKLALFVKSGQQVSVTDTIIHLLQEAAKAKGFKMDSQNRAASSR